MNEKLMTEEEEALELIHSMNIVKGIELSEKLLKENSLSKSFIPGLFSSIQSTSEVLIVSYQFTKAKRVLEDFDRIANLYPVQKVDLYNQVACVFRKMSKFRLALNLLLRVLDLPVDLTHTYLNLCAIMSDLNDHKQALAYGTKASYLAEDSYSQQLLNKTLTDQSVMALAISYYNIACQLEILGNNPSNWYLKAQKLLIKHKKQKSEIFKNINKALENVKTVPIDKQKSSRHLSYDQHASETRKSSIVSHKKNQNRNSLRSTCSQPRTEKFLPDLKHTLDTREKSEVLKNTRNSSKLSVVAHKLSRTDDFSRFDQKSNNTFLVDLKYKISKTIKEQNQYEDLFEDKNAEINHEHKISQKKSEKKPEHFEKNSSELLFIKRNPENKRYIKKHPRNATSREKESIKAKEISKSNQLGKIPTKKHNIVLRSLHKTDRTHNIISTTKNSSERIFSYKKDSSHPIIPLKSDQTEELIPIKKEDSKKSISSNSFEEEEDSSDSDEQQQIIEYDTYQPSNPGISVEIKPSFLQNTLNSPAIPAQNTDSFLTNKDPPTEEAKASASSEEENTHSVSDRSAQIASELQSDTVNPTYDESISKLSNMSSFEMKKEHFSNDEIELNEQSVEEDSEIDKESYLNKPDEKGLIQIQSWVRGYLVRNRNRRKREAQKLKLVFKKRLKIDNSNYTASVQQNDQSTLITLQNKQENYSLELPRGVDYMSTLQNITIYRGSIIVKSQEFDLKPIKKKLIKLSNQTCKLKFYSNEDFSTLLIKAKLKGSAHYIRQENVKGFDRMNILSYIKFEIIPMLAFDGESIFLDRSKAIEEKTMLTYALLENENSIKIFSLKSESYHNIIMEVNTIFRQIKETFTLKEILKFYDLEENEFLEDPHFLPFSINVAINSIELNKIDSHDYFCKKILNHKEYSIKVFQKEDQLFIQAFGENLPLLRNLTISLKELGTIFSNASEIDFPLIVKNLKVHESYLYVDYQEEYGIRNTPSRKHSTRKMTAIYGFKMLVAKDKKIKGELICKKTRVIHKKTYVLTLYRKKNYYYLKASLTGQPIYYVHKILDPSKFIIYETEEDLSQLLDLVTENSGKLALSDQPILQMYTRRASANTHVSNKTIDDEDFIIKISKISRTKISVFMSSDKRKLTKHFNEKEIIKLIGKNDLEFISECVSLEQNRIVISNSQHRPKPISNESDKYKILLRESKIVGTKVFTIFMKTAAEKPFSYTDTLVFQARQGMHTESMQKIEVSVAEACEYSGFSLQEIIPMGHFIIKNMLIISSDEIALNFSVPKFDIISTILKLQSWVRGFLARKRTKEHRGGECVFQAKARINGVYYIFKFFNEIHRIHMIAVRQTEVHTLYLKADVFDSKTCNKNEIWKKIRSGIHFNSNGKLMAATHLIENRKFNF